MLHGPCRTRYVHTKLCVSINDLHSNSKLQYWKDQTEPNMIAHGGGYYFGSRIAPLVASECLVRASRDLGFNYILPYRTGTTETYIIMHTDGYFGSRVAPLIAPECLMRTCRGRGLKYSSQYGTDQTKPNMITRQSLDIISGPVLLG